MATQTIYVGTAEAYTTIRAAIGAVTGTVATHTTLQTTILVKGPNTGGPALYTSESNIYVGVGAGWRCLINVDAYDATDKPIIDGNGAGGMCFLMTQPYNNSADSSFVTSFKNLKFQNWTLGSGGNRGIWYGANGGAFSFEKCEFNNCVSGSVANYYESLTFGGGVPRDGIAQKNKFVQCEKAFALSTGQDERLVVKNNTYVNTSSLSSADFITQVGVGTESGLSYNNSVYISYAAASTNNIIYCKTAKNNAIQAVLAGSASITGIRAFSYESNCVSGSVTQFSTISGGAGNLGGNITGSNAVSMFRSPTTFDLSIEKTSPLFNSGTTLSTVTDSISGLARPQPAYYGNPPVAGKYDIGAYEIHVPIQSKTRVLNLPEKIIISEKDNKTGSYPSISRSCDVDFSGKQPTYFSDDNTMIFSRSQNVVYPQLQVSGTKFSSYDIQSPYYFTGLEATGSITPGTSDVHVSFTPGESLSPFNDSRISINNDSQFFATGSASGTLPGFSQRLSSKSIISFDINTSGSRAIFFATNSSGNPNAKASGVGSGIAYLNFNTNKWQMLSTNNVDVYSTSSNARSTACLGFLPDAGYDINSIYESVIKNIGQPINDYGFPAASQYNATGSSCYSLTGTLSSPFLVEKIQIIVSGVFGLGPANSVKPPFVKQFFILNQTTPPNNSYLTGTFQNTMYITGNDYLQTFQKLGERDLVAYANFAFIRSDYSTGTFDGYATTWDSNNLVSSTDTNVSFGVTGSYVAQIEPKISIVSLGTGESKIRSGTNALSTTRSSLFTLLKNPEGARNLIGTSVGRSFIKSIAGSENSGTITLNAAYGTKGQAFIKARNSEVSPYVLMPNDNLIFGWQNHPKVIGSLAWSDSINDESKATRFADEITSIKVTIFGSLLQDNLPKNELTNQPMTSNSIHEVLGDNSVYDEFDVETQSILSGSYVDLIITGSMTATPLGSSNAQNVRKVQGSVVAGQAGITGSLQRFVKHSTDLSENEFLYDSIPPDPAAIIKNNGFGILDASGTGDNYISVGAPQGNAYIDIVGFMSGVDTDWYLRHSYEDVSTRSLSKNYRSVFINAFDTSNINLGTQYVTKDKTVLILGSGSSFGLITLASDNEGLTTTDESKLSSIKWLFGFGDAAYNLPQPIYKSVNVFIRNQMPQIRGFKYGMSGLFGSTYDAKFRRNKFGQLRDMLEQRQYTTTLKNGGLDNPVNVIFTQRGSDGTVISPLQTHSQNVSTFITSSVPYYDDLTKERSDNPDVTLSDIVIS